jgi:hypothetical protein
MKRRYLRYFLIALAITAFMLFAAIEFYCYVGITDCPAPPISEYELTRASAIKHNATVKVYRTQTVGAITPTNIKIEGTAESK